MRRPVVVTTVAALAAGIVAVEAPSQARSQSMPKCTPGVASPGAEAALTREINAERRRRGARPLKRISRLVRSARAHNRFMAKRRVFAHPASGLKFGKGRRAAQNLAFMPNARSAFVGFMGSPPHRKNMLNRRWRTIGVGAMSCRGMLVFTVNTTA